MSEIEKMYENAGVDYEERYNNCTLNKEGECKLKCSCDICKYSEEKYIYPLFTAEKQLKLVEFFISSVWWLNLKSLDKTLDYSLNFENKLAKLVNRLWQEFTKEQQQQVKEILE